MAVPLNGRFDRFLLMDYYVDKDGNFVYPRIGIIDLKKNQLPEITAKIIDEMEKEFVVDKAEGKINEFLGRLIGQDKATELKTVLYGYNQDKTGNRLFISRLFRQNLQFFDPAQKHTVEDFLNVIEQTSPIMMQNNIRLARDVLNGTGRWAPKTNVRKISTVIPSPQAELLKSENSIQQQAQSMNVREIERQVNTVPTQLSQDLLKMDQKGEIVANEIIAGIKALDPAILAQHQPANVFEAERMRQETEREKQLDEKKYL